MKVEDLMKVLGWDPGDEIAVEVGGTVVSGIHQPPDANPKWSRQFGDRGHNKEAFIVVKNKTRSPVIPSQPPTNEETTDVADGDNDAGNSSSGPT